MGELNRERWGLLQNLIAKGGGGGGAYNRAFAVLLI